MPNDSNLPATQSAGAPLTSEQRIERAVDKSQTGKMKTYGGVILYQNATEMLEAAKMMAMAGPALPKHLRGLPGACLAIIQDADRFGLNAYGLARQSYFVNDQLAYMAQAVHAMILSKGNLAKRPKFTYEEKGDDLRCTVTLIIRGEEEDPIIHQSPWISEIKVKNSPLWISDKRQQLGYYTIRSASRLHLSDVILGIYDMDELRASMARNITPEPEDENQDRVHTPLAVDSRLRALANESPAIADASSSLILPDDGAAAVAQSGSGPSQNEETDQIQIGDATEMVARAPETADENMPAPAGIASQFAAEAAAAADDEQPGLLGLNDMPATPPLDEPQQRVLREYWTLLHTANVPDFHAFNKLSSTFLGRKHAADTRTSAFLDRAEKIYEIANALREGGGFASLDDHAKVNAVINS